MSIGQLAKALAAAQGAIEGAHKDQTNPHFGKPYATLDSIWNACRKPLSDNGLAVIQMPSVSGNVVTVQTVLAHESGEQIESACEAVARDVSPQAIGSVITYLRRYSLAAMVGVAPEDDDANEAQPAQGQAATRQPTAPRPAPTNGASKPGDAPSPPGQQELIRAQFIRIYGPEAANPEKEAHYEAMAALERSTGKSTLAEITVAQGASFLADLRKADAYKEPVNA